MVRYYRKPRKYINESDEDIFSDIRNQLFDIVDKLGYTFKEKTNTDNSGTGIIYLSEQVKIIVKYSVKVDTITVKIDPSTFNCLHSTKTIDNVSVDLQTATMIIDTIQTKLP